MRLLNSIKQRASSSEMVRNSAWAFGLRIVGLALSFFVIWGISRLYSARILGVFTLVQSVLMILATFGRFGLNLSLVKLNAISHVKGNWKDIRHHYKLAILIATIVSVLMVGALYLIKEPVIHYLIPSLSQFEDKFWIIGLVLFPLVYLQITADAFRGLKKISISVFLQRILLHALVLMSIALFFFQPLLSPELSVLFSLFSGMIISSIVACVWYIMTIYRAENMSRDTTDKQGVKSIIYLAFPLLLSSSLLLVNNWADSLIIGALASEAEVGKYNVVLRIAAFTTIPLFAVNAIATPRFAAEFKSNNMLRLQQTITNASKLILVISLPIIILCILSSQFLLSIFGAEYIVGTLPLIVLLVGQLFNSASGSVMNILQMTGYEKLGNRIVLISALWNVFFNLILIPRYGILGAAISSATSLILWNLLGVYFVWRRLGIRSFYLPLFLR